MADVPVVRGGVVTGRAHAAEPLIDTAPRPWVGHVYAGRKWTMSPAPTGSCTPSSVAITNPPPP